MTLLTVAQVAEILNIQPSTVTKMLRERRMPHYRIGGQYRIGLAQLNDWLDRNQTYRDWKNPTLPLLEESDFPERPAKKCKERRCHCGTLIGKSERRCSSCREAARQRKIDYQRAYYQNVLKAKRRSKVGTP